ncbi:MAG: hypothetical protein K2W82_06070 [Candidatus Obscuribacterales bacterium]|nr:hypothetical protein [Candidatus Obscuribacterales bacterium]
MGLESTARTAEQPEQQPDTGKFLTDIKNAEATPKKLSFNQSDSLALAQTEQPQSTTISDKDFATRLPEIAERLNKYSVKDISLVPNNGGYKLEANLAKEATILPEAGDEFNHLKVGTNFKADVKQVNGVVVIENVQGFSANVTRLFSTFDIPITKIEMKAHPNGTEIKTFLDGPLGVVERVKIHPDKLYEKAGNFLNDANKKPDQQPTQQRTMIGYKLPEIYF